MKKQLIHATLTFGFVSLVIPFVSHAQLTYQSMTRIPGFIQTTDGSSLSNLLTSLYLISISIAAILAVVKIIIAGLKYSLSDVITNKSDAIRDIRGALLGLIIVISAVLILTVINPDIVRLDDAPAEPLPPLTDFRDLVGE